MSFTSSITENTLAASGDDASAWDQQIYELQADSFPLFEEAASSSPSVQSSMPPNPPDTLGDFDFAHEDKSRVATGITSEIETLKLIHTEAGEHTSAGNPLFNPSMINTGNFNRDIIYPPTEHQLFPSHCYPNQMNVATGNSNYQSNMAYMYPSQLQQQPPTDPTSTNIYPSLDPPSNQEYKRGHMYDMIEARAECLGKTLSEFREAKAMAVKKYKGATAHIIGLPTLLTSEEYAFVSDFFLWQSLFPEDQFPVPMLASIENDPQLYQAIMGEPATPKSMVQAQSSPAPSQSIPRQQSVYETTSKQRQLLPRPQPQSRPIQDFVTSSGFVERLAADLDEEKTRAAEAKATYESRKLRNDQVRKVLPLEDWSKANK